MLKTLACALFGHKPHLTEWTLFHGETTKVLRPCQRCPVYVEIVTTRVRRQESTLGGWR